MTDHIDPARVTPTSQYHVTGVQPEGTQVHVFERAGLGRAPFRFVRLEHRVGPIEWAPGCFAGAPGQPMGTCDYCGEGIADCCVIRDADGREFIVGNVCVGKAGDAGLRKVVNAAVNARKLEARHAAEKVRIDAARERMKDEPLRAKLAALPHPYTDMAARGLTRLDWAEWMLKWAGNRGMLQVAKYLKEVV